MKGEIHMVGMNISNIAGGALVERANEKIQEVLNNIMDLNTDAEKKRKVVITLEFKGNDDRDTADILFDVKNTLVAARKIKTIVAFEHDGQGRVVAEELCKGGVVGQVFIDTGTGEIVEPRMSSKVVNIK